MKEPLNPCTDKQSEGYGDLVLVTKDLPNGVPFVE